MNVLEYDLKVFLDKGWSDYERFPTLTEAVVVADRLYESGALAVVVLDTDGNLQYQRDGSMPDKPRAPLPTPVRARLSPLAERHGVERKASF
jgi:hypothetical protein